MRKLLIFITFLLGVASCVYPFDPVLEGTSEDMVVFEGSIVVGGVSKVRISKVKSFGDEPRPVSRSVVWVEDDGGGRYNSTSSSLDAEYTIPTQGSSPDMKYRMVAEVDGKKYSSDWIKPLAPPVLERVEFVPSPIGNNLDVFVALKGGEESTGYMGIYFDETWEFHADYMCRYILDTENWEVIPRGEPYPNYWCWNSASSSMSILDHSEYDGGRIEAYPVHSFSRSDKRNQRKYSINVKAITLPKETYRYLKNLDDISNGSGSLFSPNPGEMASNVACESDPSTKALGYVTASLETSLRAYVDNRYYVEIPPSQSYLSVPPNMFAYLSYYQNNYYPVDFMTMEVGEQVVQDIFWGPMRCIDCVVEGGTKQKPDFWEDE